MEPEGIAVGRGPTFYTGSLAPATFGQILVGDLLTGQVSELVAPTGRPALGMKYDPRSDLLFVAGGSSGRNGVRGILGRSDRFLPVPASVESAASDANDRYQ
jgi:hypothetical protein